MAYLRLDPIFSHIVEIRMGSPFNFCDLALKGNWVPGLPEYDWQDKFAKSKNGRYLVLVAWDIDKNNDPGFRLILIDIKEMSIKETPRIAGCCESIEWSVSGFACKIFSYLSEKRFAYLRELKYQKPKPFKSSAR
jgi:hypothetical protein